MAQDPPHPDSFPDATVRYAEHDAGVVDLHLPSVPNGTLVVLVHGGFWKERYDRTHTRRQARSLAEAGYLVATPEYRRVGGGGGWPTTGTDLEEALAALPELADLVGVGWDRAVMTGHSAGGHLALWLLSRPLPFAFDVVVGIAPVCDLVLADELHLGSGAVAQLLDGAPITEADPMTLLADPPAAEVVLVHGVADDEVPIELSRGFAAVHPWARLTELRGVGHYEFLDPRSPAWVTVAQTLHPPSGP
ncbi:alpha/beta hydrolase [Nocardioides marmoriginsengisoli]|uniref:Alpha/beta hydrolase n=1 Tax=Nocardioides marmoriginsengisoli TaxID=661483 RepID=A0A3N0CG24_9ACTN|nr:prolyl oligopeptidase family serine peptidase [Nocardioides marmoriginsengisoli]RNL62171.1 alpha/beta hydrolase [Nocardioides marmoriginsengisoli]